MNDLTHPSAADLFDAAPYLDDLARKGFTEPRSPEWVHAHGLSTVAAALGLPLAWSDVAPFSPFPQAPTHAEAQERGAGRRSRRG